MGRSAPEVFRWSQDRCTVSIKLSVGKRERSNAHAREPPAWWQRLPLGTALWRARQRLGGDLGRPWGLGNTGLRARARSGADRIGNTCARLRVWRRPLRAPLLRHAG